MNSISSACSGRSDSLSGDSDRSEWPVPFCIHDAKVLYDLTRCFFGVHNRYTMERIRSMSNKMQTWVYIFSSTPLWLKQRISWLPTVDSSFWKYNSLIPFGSFFRSLAYCAGRLPSTAHSNLPFSSKKPWASIGDFGKWPVFNTSPLSAGRAEKNTRKMQQNAGYTNARFYFFHFASSRSKYNWACRKVLEHLINYFLLRNRARL